MIVGGLIDFVLWLVELIFSSFQAISLPFNLITVLLDFMKIGSFVVGGDLLALTFTCVFFWLTFKFSAGAILFVYKLLPLT